MMLSIFNKNHYIMRDRYAKLKKRFKPERLQKYYCKMTFRKKIKSDKTDLTTNISIHSIL